MRRANTYAAEKRDDPEARRNPFKMARRSVSGETIDRHV